LRFAVSDDVFSLFPGYVVGVVVAEDVCNSLILSEDVLNPACEHVRDNVTCGAREHAHVRAWRDAFEILGYNPNRFPPSIEALVARVLKTGAVPSINPAVDMINAHSLRYLVPMGAHDIDRLSGDFEVRYSNPGERFAPMGGKDVESVDQPEIVYADGLEIRTRRWIWRQGDNAKVDVSTRTLFCPVDGFYDLTHEAVLSARASLAGALATHFGCKVTEYWVDKDRRSIQIR